MLSKMLSSECAPAGAGTKPSKVCGVCGDRAKSYHFGGISCDSCKAFFRRSVQNDAHRAFQCAFQQQQQQHHGSGTMILAPAGRCDINMSNRKCCQFCRFRKCLDIGMEPSWVMTEEERVHMLRARMVKRQRTGHHHNSRRHQRESDTYGRDSLSPSVVVDLRPFRPRLPTATSPLAESVAGSCRTTPAVDSESDYPESPEGGADTATTEIDDDDATSDVITHQLGLSATESAEIDVLVAGFRRRFAPAVSPATRRPHRNRPPSMELSMILLFMVTIQKLVRFARGDGNFASLPLHLQVALLRSNIFEMFLLVHFSDIEDIDVLPSFDNDTVEGDHWNGAFPRKRKLEEEEEDSGEFVSVCPFLSGAGCRRETNRASEPDKATESPVKLEFPFATNGSVGESTSSSPLVAAFRSTVRDSRTLVLLLMVILFCPDSAPCDQDGAVERRQLHYCTLLGKQLTQAHGGHDHGQLAKLLLLLPGLREIKETHVSHHFDLSDCDDLDITELLHLNSVACEADECDPDTVPNGSDQFLR